MIQSYLRHVALPVPLNALGFADGDERGNEAALCGCLGCGALLVGTRDLHDDLEPVQWSSARL